MISTRFSNSPNETGAKANEKFEVFPTPMERLFAERPKASELLARLIDRLRSWPEVFAMVKRWNRTAPAKVLATSVPIPEEAGVDFIKIPFGGVYGISFPVVS